MELVGTHEVAEMLAISRQRVQQLVAAGRFPEPAAKLRGGWVWNADAVRKWAKAEGRGQPR